MSNNNVTPSEFFSPDSQVAHLGLIACPGAEELCKMVDGHLVRWAREIGMDVDKPEDLRLIEKYLTKNI